MRCVAGRRAPVAARHRRPPTSVAANTMMTCWIALSAALGALCAYTNGAPTPGGKGGGYRHVGLGTPSHLGTYPVVTGTVPQVPVAPVYPGVPGGPVVPGQPGVPGGPVGPGYPGVPVGPVGPVNPGVPVGPVVPVNPGVPVGPVVPVNPGVPVGPVVPVNPGVPSVVTPGHPGVPDVPVNAVLPEGKRNLGTKSQTDSAGKIISTGNAKAFASGGARASDMLPDQKSGADVRLTLKTQREGASEGVAGSVGRSDAAIPDGRQHSSSQGDAHTEVRSTGQSSTEADANARGATLLKNAKTDATGGSSSATVNEGTAAGASETLGSAGRKGPHSTDAGSGAASQSTSTGSGGSKSVGRGRGAAFGGGTTSLAGSQSETDTIGDGKAQSVQRGGAGGELDGNGVLRVGGSKARSQGDVKTLGSGASGSGESTSKGTAGKDSKTSSESVARNQLKSTRTGRAAADVITEGLSALGLDTFTKDLVVDTKSKAASNQRSVGSASSAANGASTAGSTLAGGASLTDSTVQGKTSKAGEIRSVLETRGQARVSEGKPVVQPLPEAPSILSKPSAAPVIPPPPPTPPPTSPPYVPPPPVQPSHVPPYVDLPQSQESRAPVYVPVPSPAPVPYVPPHVGHKPVYHYPKKAPYVSQKKGYRHYG
nr:CP43k-like protein 2 isoform 2 [Chelonibia testudinaria]